MTYVSIKEGASKQRYTLVLGFGADAKIKSGMHGISAIAKVVKVSRRAWSENFRSYVSKDRQGFVCHDSDCSGYGSTTYDGCVADAARHVTAPNHGYAVIPDDDFFKARERAIASGATDNDLTQRTLYELACVRDRDFGFSLAANEWLGVTDPD